MKEKLVLIGGGGHCRSCIDVIEAEGRYSVEKIVDLPENFGQSVIGDYKINASDEDIKALSKSSYQFLITFGQITSAELRIKMFEHLMSLEADIATVISPLAHVSGYARIGKGSIIMHHALVNAGASIGRNCIINSKTLVEHDAVVEDHCHISTGSVVNGGAVIGANSFLGSNSMVKQYLEIKRGSVIGAGKAILKVTE